MNVKTASRKKWHKKKERQKERNLLNKKKLPINKA